MLFFIRFLFVAKVFKYHYITHILCLEKLNNSFTQLMKFILETFFSGK